MSVQMTRGAYLITVDAPGLREQPRAIRCAFGWAVAWRDRRGRLRQQIYTQPEHAAARILALVEAGYLALKEDSPALAATG